MHAVLDEGTVVAWKLRAGCRSEVVQSERDGGLGRVLIGHATSKVSAEDVRRGHATLARRELLVLWAGQSVLKTVSGVAVSQGGDILVTCHGHDHQVGIEGGSAGAIVSTGRLIGRS